MKLATRTRAFERVALLGDAKLALPDLFEEAGRLLTSALPRDAACWHAMDPVSLIETSCHVQDVPPPDEQTAAAASVTPAALNWLREFGVGRRVLATAGGNRVAGGDDSDDRAADLRGVRTDCPRTRAD